MTTPTYTSADIQSWLDSLAADTRGSLMNLQPLIVGIHTGGVWVAEALMQQLGEDFFDAPLGTLNIAYYRDDFTRIGMHPQVTPSDLPFSIEDRHVLLVDDVLQSGRTVRAALNELFDYGRPASVHLAVLIDRNERELPLQADFIGQTIDVPEGHQIKLTQATPLAVELLQVTLDEAEND